MEDRWCSASAFQAVLTRLSVSISSSKSGIRSIGGISGTDSMRLSK
jgi:hypothetical protein